MQKIISLLIVVILLSGAGLLLYPTLSDQYNRLMNARRILAYEQVAQTLDPGEDRALIEAAEQYNQRLRHNAVRDAFTNGDEEVDAEYMSLLNVAGDGVMGYIEIPKIGVRLPIYHTTDDDVLRHGAGHMEGTALPVGGPGTHCGLAGHRALSSARLFTDLDQMVPGDIFYLTVLGRTLVYQVDQINVVLPNEMDYMAAEAGEDLLTLVTCTPYGLNTHRLLVRGRRAAMDDVMDELAARDGVQRLPDWKGIAICAAPMALIGMLAAYAWPRRKYRVNKPGKTK